MGEAKRKKFVDTSSVRRSELLRRFERLGIDPSMPGFFDDPQFLAEESNDRRFLESYAEWVIHRERTPEYDDRVRDVMARLSPIIAARLDRHQWYGGCIAVTLMVTRMLERLGLWSAVVRGSVALRTSDGGSRHFRIVDENEGHGSETGHYWLIVPPYDIVDLTLHHQRWVAGDEKYRELAPKIVLAEGTDVIQAQADDVIAPPMLQFGLAAEIHHHLPDQKRFSAIVPARRVALDGLELRYIASGSTAPDAPLEDINSAGRAGVPAIQIWNEDVAPAFGMK